MLSMFTKSECYGSKKHMKKINTIQTGCIYHRLRLSPHSQIQQQVNSSWVITAFMLLLAQSFKPEPNPEPLHHHIWLPHWITDRSGVCDFILRKWRVGLASCKDCTVKGFIPSGNILCHFLFRCLSIVGKLNNLYPFQEVKFKPGYIKTNGYVQIESKNIIYEDQLHTQLW